MASNEGFKIYVKDGQAQFEDESRSFTVAEGRVHNVAVDGMYADLSAYRLKVGDPAPQFVSIEGLSKPLRVLNYNVTKEAGLYGRMTLSLVEASSDSEPYHVTATVDMQPVEKKLITHPKLQSESTRDAIHKWELTDENLRWKMKDGKLAPYYYYVTDPESASASVAQGFVEDEWAKKYCYATLYGIENYNVYLPVIEITSRYLKMPGVEIDADTHEVSGTLDPEGLQSLGTYATPPFEIMGFKDGEWFKPVDRIQQDANGGWQRVEQWTYTNDLRFKWIYADKSAYAVIPESAAPWNGGST